MESQAVPYNDIQNAVFQAQTTSIKPAFYTFYEIWNS